MNVSKNLMIHNRTYDVLKYVAQIVLPALGTLYFALSQIWGFPYGEEVVGTIVAVGTFLGVLLGISSVAYKQNDERFDGSIDVVEERGVDTFRLNLDGNPYEILESKDELIFKVEHPENNPD